MNHVKKLVVLFVYFISNDFVLKYPTFLLVHISIWYFLNIEFYKIISVETETYNTQWATETEFTQSQARSKLEPRLRLLFIKHPKKRCQL